jgi:asparagine synthase (glutamine-hydrolysing)
MVGWWSMGGPVDPAVLDRFTDALAHRGPDGRGTYVDHGGRLGLGHRRLAILDISSSGAQPMAYADGRYRITYNGEIYNFLELRRELEGLGHRFRSESDTEVILAAYAQWGEACQRRFNGMWGFAIWDERERTLFLSRDRFGVKPLHYYQDSERFAFASEMKAFYACPWFPRRHDPAMVALAVTDPFAVEGGEPCILQGVRHLLGGHQLVLKEGGEPRVSRWWNTLDHLHPVPRRWEEQVEQYRELFLDACRVRMRSDVPLCTSLSGGMDSSSVLCGISSLSGATQERRPQDWRKAFIASFPGTSQDETSLALATAQAAGAEPVVETLNMETLAAHFDEVIRQMDDVYDQDIQVGAYLVYRAQRRRGLTVSLDGHGGDETLAGYRQFAWQGMDEAMRHHRWGRALDLRRTLQGMYPPERRSEVPGVTDLLRGRYLRPLARRLQVAKTETEQPVHEEWLKVKPAAPRWQNPEDEKRMRAEGRDSLFISLYRETHGKLLPTILRQFERASMAHGVEVRSPFMDWRLVVLAFSLPGESKLGHGLSKRILREAVRGMVPEDVRTRTVKTAFANPLQEWLAGPLQPWILDRLRKPGFLQSALWDGPAIAAAVERGYRSGDLQPARRAMPFLQVQRLMEEAAG